MKRSLFACRSACIAVLLGALGHAQGAEPEYTVTDLTALLDGVSSGTAINAGGMVAGNTDAQGFIWSADSEFTTPGAFGAEGSFAASINDAGQIVGYATDFTTSTTTAVIVEPDGSTTNIAPLPGDSFNEAHGINNRGQVVGISTGAVNRAFFRSATGELAPLDPLLSGKAAAANAVNDSGLVVGSAVADEDLNRHAVRWTHGETVVDTPADLGVLPGGVYSEAVAINAAGQIVGYSETSSGTGTTKQAFLYDETASPKLRGLGLLLAGGWSRANGINDAGQIVGAVYAGAGDSRAFLITDGVTMRDLNTLIPADSGWFLTEATAINAAGQITGYGTTPGGKIHAYLLTPIKAVVPTPRAAPPTIAIKGKKKVTTTKAKLMVKGSTTGSVTSVTYRIGKKKANKRVTGTAVWKFKAALKPGRNKILVTAHGPGGDSAPARLTVIRQSLAPSPRLP